MTVMPRTKVAKSLPPLKTSFRHFAAALSRGVYLVWLGSGSPAPGHPVPSTRTAVDDASGGWYWIEHTFAVSHLEDRRCSSDRILLRLAAVPFSCLAPT